MTTTNRRAEIVMTDREVRGFVDHSRTATVASVGPEGMPHLVAMWYGLVDGQIAFETKAKSQKVANLRRDPTIAVMIESGDTYDQLRGVAIEGTAVLVEDGTDDRYWRAAVSVHERYIGPYTPDQEPTLTTMMHKRVVILVSERRVRTWDHRKMGLAPQPYAGSTARPTSTVST